MRSLRSTGVLLAIVLKHRPDAADHPDFLAHSRKRGGDGTFFRGEDDLTGDGSIALIRLKTDATCEWHINLLYSLRPRPGRRQNRAAQALMPPFRLMN
jgi:hypothetical protein